LDAFIVFYEPLRPISLNPITKTPNCQQLIMLTVVMPFCIPLSIQTQPIPKKT